MKSATASMVLGAVCAFAVTSVAAGDTTVVAGSVNSSTEHSGATFGASLEWVVLTPTTGRLFVTLQNLSPEEVGGYLTGFAFRMASSDPDASAVLSATTDADFLDTGPVAASPFGMFDAGCALNANWLGGGNPSAGIAIGDSADFTFDVAAADAALLSVHDFASGEPYPSIVVRFRGLETDAGSDKVPGRGVTCDWNDDGMVNSTDFFDYLADFFMNDADYDLNGVTNIKDFFDFLRCFFTA